MPGRAAFLSAAGEWAHPDNGSTTCAVALRLARTSLTQQNCLSDTEGNSSMAVGVSAQPGKRAPLTKER